MRFDPSKAWATLQHMLDALVAGLPAYVFAVIVFALFLFTGRGVRSVVRRYVSTHQRRRNVGLVLGRLAQAGFVLLGLLVALSIALPSFEPANIISILGIGSVAIGFAFRDILQNFLAGILLLLTEPFRIGDQIVVNDYEGTVEDIQMRATLIKTYDNRRVVIPNSDLFTNSVTVNTAFPQRRTDYEVGIGYGDDLERARELILEAVRGVEGVAKEPAPDVKVVALGDYAVNLRTRWWTDSRRRDVIAVQDRVLAAVKATLTENGVDLPYPTRQILFHDQTEASDGDRSGQREGWPAGKGEVPRSRSAAAALGRLAEVIENDRGEDGKPEDRAARPDAPARDVPQ